MLFSNKERLKQQAAEAAFSLIPADCILGIGTGSTVHYLIEILAQHKNHIKGAVASSLDTEKKLKQAGILCLNLNSEGPLPLYIDGADEVDPHFNLIKGGGGALTREKIIAAASDKFICIVDESKCVDVLGAFPLPIEVIPMARSYVSRQMVALGGKPEFRAGKPTDNGNDIIDVHFLDCAQPLALEQKINQIAGVVCVGLFAQERADQLIVASSKGIDIRTR
jgi:ribose 5-phosphate isomerase A